MFPIVVFLIKKKRVGELGENKCKHINYSTNQCTTFRITSEGTEYKGERNIEQVDGMLHTGSAAQWGRQLASSTVT